MGGMRIPIVVAASFAVVLVALVVRAVRSWRAPDQPVSVR